MIIFFFVIFSVVIFVNNRNCSDLTCALTMWLDTVLHLICWFKILLENLFSFCCCNNIFTWYRCLHLRRTHFLIYIVSKSKNCYSKPHRVHKYTKTHIMQMFLSLKYMWEIYNCNYRMVYMPHQRHILPQAFVPPNRNCWNTNTPFLTKNVPLKSFSALNIVKLFPIILSMLTFVWFFLFSVFTIIRPCLMYFV